ncbi:SPOR domain-containing protein [Pseudomonas sp. Gutcm_11s]|uniref:SPOR domain-containing protein n=1 Tax=Pseudomonas sp. Gutcm_11s TaxID=3026088 RepID=UPI002362BBFB|nr:SPOR domain-containing protein [Pseudomonas sp. Gutcm_11s]MDD0842602.1 SPOR domain-containing protein [Pseudomonas sp. Gutcm_11s]
MAVLDKGLKQRIVGALVLVALAVIFLPMLFSREDELRQVVVDAPAMPDKPSMPEVALDPVVVPEPVAEDEVPPVEPVPQTPSEPIATPSQPVQPAQVQVEAPKPAAAAAEQKPVSGLDANNLPISWSVQLASLSSRAGAEKLQQTLRSSGYNAYIRSFDGMNRVFVGPVIERAEADRLRDLLNRQQNLKGFVVRFQPENG